MTRVVLWIVAVSLFICAEIAAINFVGFGLGFPLIFLLVAAVFVGVVVYPLWQRREIDEAGHAPGADPSIPPIDQPDYRAPWQGPLPNPPG